MSRRKIDLGQPANPLRPYTHLVPLIEDLVQRGNRISRRGSRGDMFISSQEGEMAVLAEPLDIEYLQETYDLSGYDYSERLDRLFDTRNWVSIYGSDGRLARVR